MARIRNISTGPRGAYLKGVFVEADPGGTIEADDFVTEWFEEVKDSPVKEVADLPDAAKPDPLDHDGDGRKGGSVAKAKRTAD